MFKQQKSSDVEMSIITDGQVLVIAGKKVRAYKYTNTYGLEEIEVKPLKK